MRNSNAKVAPKATKKVVKNTSYNYKLVGSLWDADEDKKKIDVLYTGKFKFNPKAFSPAERKAFARAIYEGQEIYLSIGTYHGPAKGSNAPKYEAKFGSISS